MEIKFSYTRVSTDHQHTERQDAAILNYATIPEVNRFMDKMTGKTDERPQYQALKVILQNLSDINARKEPKDRDTIELIIEELDRIGRTKKIISDELRWFSDRGIKVRILEIPTTLIEIDSQNDWVLDLVNKLLIEVYTALAEQELQKKEKRVREGIEAAKLRGAYKGRKPIEVDQKLLETIYKRWKNQEITARQAMSLLNLKTNTFYRIVKQYEEKKGIKDLNTITES